MKIVLATLNSKFIHSSLAPWYLKAYCGDMCGEIKVMEFTINDSLDSIFAAIYSEEADVLAFSCYIWNITHVLKLAESLKQVSPETAVILGGPEVSFDAEELMDVHSFIDYIITGEGEVAFSKLIRHLNGGILHERTIEGVYSRKDGIVISGEQCTMLEDLDSIPTPYTDEMLSAQRGRIIYFESSRGCPFSCSYCISSTFDGVRYFSMERVKADLLRIINSGVKQVKFVDRTFNCSRARAKEIFRFIMNNHIPGMNFHFEAAADLFDDDMLDILSKAPAGLIQFEIGVQTVNTAALEAIGRKTDLEKVFRNVGKLSVPGNIHIHLDLIAGLPFEGLDSFRNSFDRVYSCNPGQLQLGFLKLLKGSRIRRDAELYGYKFRSYPPYEVICSRFISTGELLLLKAVEELVERYYNSGRFIMSLDYVIASCFESPFDFYVDFYRYNAENHMLDRPLPARELYMIMLNYSRMPGLRVEAAILNELLKFDFLSSDNTGNLPSGLESKVEPGFKEACFDFLKDKDNIARCLPEYSGMPAKQIFKHVHFERFSFDVTQGRPFPDMKWQPAVVLFDHVGRRKFSINLQNI